MRSASAVVFPISISRALMERSRSGSSGRKVRWTEQLAPILPILGHAGARCGLIGLGLPPPA
jgi:hypothetical protein